MKKKENTYRGQLAHERSQNRARREPVANVSIHQIAEPATIHSDQPSLISDPPNHTPPHSENIPTVVEVIAVI